MAGEVQKKGIDMSKEIDNLWRKNNAA